jgi:hypothetical protein
MQNYSYKSEKTSPEYTLFFITNIDYKKFKRDIGTNYMIKQRNVDPTHVEKMIKYQEKYYTDNKCYDFPTPLQFCYQDNKYYIADGQHRDKVIEYLLHPFNIMIVVKTCDNMVSHFEFVNTNKPVVYHKNNEVKNIEKHLLTEYLAFNKTSKKPLRPHFNTNTVKTILNDCKDVDYKPFVNSMEGLNNYIKDNYISMGISNVHYNKCLKGSKYFYCGALPNSSWVYAIYLHTRGVNFKDIDFKVDPYTNKSKSFSNIIRAEVWNKYNKTTDAKCFCCKKEDISSFNFDMGHVISRHKRGNDSVENLRPICRPCNNHMRTTDMRVYMKEHFGYVT